MTYGVNYNRDFFFFHNFVAICDNIYSYKNLNYQSDPLGLYKHVLFEICVRNRITKDTY